MKCRVVYTINECTKFLNYEEAGRGMDEHSKMTDGLFNYRVCMVSWGVLVNVFDGNVNKGYLFYDV